MRPRFLAGLCVLLAMAGCTTERQTSADRDTTSTYRQGGSTATITQEGGGSPTVQRTITGPDGQTIIQQQGGSTAVIRQQN